MDKMSQPKATPAGRPEPRLADFGGQYRAAEGISTKPMRSALLDWFEQERRAAAGQADVAW